MIMAVMFTMMPITKLMRTILRAETELSSAKCLSPAREARCTLKQEKKPNEFYLKENEGFATAFDRGGPGVYMTLNK